MCNPLLCHHVFLCRPDNPRLVSQVPVTIQVLDVNDNAPAIAGDSDDIIVCESSRAGQVRCAHSFKIKNNVSLSRLLDLSYFASLSLTQTPTQTPSPLCVSDTIRKGFICRAADFAAS